MRSPNKKKQYPRELALMCSTAATAFLSFALKTPFRAGIKAQAAKNSDERFSLKEVDKCSSPLL